MIDPEVASIGEAGEVGEVGEAGAVGAAVGRRAPLARTRRGPGPLARRPEIVPVTATAVAWSALAADSMGWWGASAGTGHSGHGIFTATGIAMVAAMTAAMMGPLSIGGVRTVAFTSPWWRAGRAAGIFFVTFVAAWTVIALCLATVASMLDGVLGSAATAAGALVLVCALAEFDPGRAVRMASCDRPMRLRGNGFDADVDCARFGLLSAARGVRLCALPMLAMLAMPGSLPVMAVLTGLTVTDRITEGRRRLLLAALYTVLGVGLLWAGGNR